MPYFKFNNIINNTCCLYLVVRHCIYATFSEYSLYTFWWSRFIVSLVFGEPTINQPTPNTVFLFLDAFSLGLRNFPFINQCRQLSGDRPLSGLHIVRSQILEIVLPVLWCFRSCQMVNNYFLYYALSIASGLVHTTLYLRTVWPLRRIYAEADTWLVD